MDYKTESWNLHWGALFAGALVAIAIAWTGSLLGGLLTMISPGTSSGWGWFGGILQVLFWAAGAFVGSYVAARSASSYTRASGMIHGLVVWGLVGLWSALSFVFLRGTVAIIAGGTAGAVRLTLGFATVALMLSFVSALLGGLAGQTGALQAADLPRGFRGTRPSATMEPGEASAQPPEERPPQGPGSPPAIH